jgi:hypothetical protein
VAGRREDRTRTRTGDGAENNAGTPRDRLAGRTWRDGSRVRYPIAVTSKPTFERSIGINAVWFHWYCRQQAAQGKPIPKTPGDIPKAAAKAAKAYVTELTYTHLQDFPVTIRHTNYSDKRGQTIERLGAFTETGNLLGLITPDSETYLTEAQQLTLKFAIAADGNVRAVWGV